MHTALPRHSLAFDQGWLKRRRHPGQHATHLQDLNAALEVWLPHIDNAVKSSWPNQGRVQDILPVPSTSVLSPPSTYSTRSDRLTAQEGIG